MPRYVKHRISRFQNELVNRHYDEVETMYRTMRIWRHDYHNHIQTLSAYMSMGQYEEASGYLERLAEDLTKVDTVLRTGNVMVDAILNSKLTLMRERRIKVDATAAVPRELAIPDIELSVLIGNLMDNAMEACMKLPEEQRFIRIYIDVIKKQLYICVTNSMDGAARRKGNHFLSDKQGSHGFGLLRIDEIVISHSGYLNRKAEDGIFATEVMLPLVSG
ncbi:MAG: GHKL domain-containing protein [Lachnospiraceae bacterium]